MQDDDTKPGVEQGVDHRRRVWLIATSAVGCAGCAAAVVPFVGSLAPSAKSRAAGAPVEVDVGTLEPGSMMTVAWRGKPVWVLHRTDAMLADVKRADPFLADPHTEHPYSMPLPPYCANEYRARADHKQMLVVVAVCTHLGCTPTQRFTPGPQPNLPDNWPGGFLCPCHGSTYDLAGRVFKNKPAPQNLDVPPYMFTSANTLVIGRDEKGEA